MNWDDVINYQILELGRFKLLAGNLLVGILVGLVTMSLVSVLKKVFLNPRFIIDKIDSKRRMSFFLISKYFVWIIGSMIILKVIGVDISLFLFGSTALLVGIGFGLQDIFKDLISGLFLLFEGTLKIGDVIETNGMVGRVSEINIRSSQIITRDNITMIIPNSKFVVEKFLNWSHEDDAVRFTIKVGVAYGSDVEDVVKVLESTLIRNKAVVSSPKPFVQFSNFGESSLEFKMIFWSKHSFEIENIQSDIRRDVYKELKNNGLGIPFPQRDVNIKGLDQYLKNQSK